VIVPENYREKDKKWASLWITGGHNDDKIPHELSPDILVGAELATGGKMIAGVLFQVPNQPIVFPSDPDHRHRSEDAIIAYTWMQFINDTTKPEWIAQLPMTKSGIKAMDTIETFMADEGNPTGHVVNIEKWIITGASKRGWTTWLVGAVAPDRVHAMVPIVLDLLNLIPSMHHMWRAYGGWTWAMKDYVNAGYPPHIDTPESVLLTSIIDPLAYKERLTMPKMVVNSGNDEFFMPDNTHYWWDDMPGPKHWMFMPNSDHTTVTGIGEELPSIKVFLQTIMADKPVPEFSWNIDKETGDITVDVGSNKVHAVHMWTATTCNGERRDLRAFSLDSPCTCGIEIKNHCFNTKVGWHKTKLDEEPNRPGIYVASNDEPAVGWTFFFVDVQFKKHILDEDEEPSLIESKMWNFGQERRLEAQDLGWPIDFPEKFEFTTLVSIVPDTFPYPDCHGESCTKKLV